MGPTGGGDGRSDRPALGLVNFQVPAFDRALEVFYATGCGSAVVPRTNGPRGSRAVSSDIADAIVWMLQQVVQGGTRGGAALTDRPVAGKTGTFRRGRDLWFIGFVPQLTTGVWLGYDNNRKSAPPVCWPPTPGGRSWHRSPRGCRSRSFRPSPCSPAASSRCPRRRRMPRAK